MSRVREIHVKAMELAQLALVAREKGEWEYAISLALQASELEKQAAEIVPFDVSSEPTRSILYRSAASLAYQGKELQEAQRMIARGLSGYPPPEIEQELKDLLEQINFEQYLMKTEDAELANEDLQLTMKGDAVGYGMVYYSEFQKRLHHTRLLIDRTIQRLLGREYQRSVRSSKKYKLYTPVVAAPSGGSFAIIIKLINPKGEQIPLFPKPTEIIENIMTGINYIQQGREDDLREHIKDDRYRIAFFSSTRELAPDGERIKSIHFATSGRSVSLTKQHKEIEIKSEIKEVKKTERRPITVEGLLDFATSRGVEMIGLTTEDKDRYDIYVEEGMDDMVRSYYKQFVEVTGIYDGKQIYLQDIQAID